MWAALSTWEKVKFAWDIFKATREEITKEDVEKLKVCWCLLHYLCLSFCSWWHI